MSNDGQNEKINEKIRCYVELYLPGTTESWGEISSLEEKLSSGEVSAAEAYSLTVLRMNRLSTMGTHAEWARIMAMSYPELRRVHAFLSSVKPPTKGFEVGAYDEFIAAQNEFKEKIRKEHGFCYVEGCEDIILDDSDESVEAFRQTLLSKSGLGKVIDSVKNTSSPTKSELLLVNAAKDPSKAVQLAEAMADYASTDEYFAHLNGEAIDSFLKSINMEKKERGYTRQELSEIIQKVKDARANFEQGVSECREYCRFVANDLSNHYRTIHESPIDADIDFYRQHRERIPAQDLERIEQLFKRATRARNWSRYIRTRRMRASVADYEIRLETELLRAFARIKEHYAYLGSSKFNMPEEFIALIKSGEFITTTSIGETHLDDMEKHYASLIADIEAALAHVEARDRDGKRHKLDRIKQIVGEEYVPHDWISADAERNLLNIASADSRAFVRDFDEKCERDAVELSADIEESLVGTRNTTPIRQRPHFINPPLDVRKL